MAKKYTKEELTKLADKFFKRGIDKMIATTDGQFFYPEAEGNAYSYAKDKKVKVEVIEKPAKKVATKKEVTKTEK